MLEGFKQFAARGNVLDLAVGVIIGAAFCVSRIPITATRCPYCTSDLGAARV